MKARKHPKINETWQYNLDKIPFSNPQLYIHIFMKTDMGDRRNRNRSNEITTV